MGDMEIVAGVTCYLVALVILLPMAGFGGEEADCHGQVTTPANCLVLPRSPERVQNNMTTEIPTQGESDAITECLITGGFIFSIPAAITELIFGGDFPFVDCSRKTVSVFYEVFSDAFDYGVKAFKFFFQMLTLDVEGLHPSFILLFFHLPGILLAVVGVRTIRGVSN